ncbi:flavin-containing monooxygenase [Gordonia hydrophobica]|uniref:NAD(P)/FAD-dependent oxidoreductase n=1 Tax=Gordonia hydrophobica TaxID=40516 RepID=A0ABZ2U5U3_9ACTN|nr:NAD(P)/FAD-dependent oxidoreductase [Gordonia hydrophobica]MBM7365648.1 cation diffusion facilitator CzcD-associated flavoprotein CzcO [Gordonia hydrophobica]
MSDVRQHGTNEDPLDVLIVGAGLSGIDTAYRLREQNPGLDYRIVERRSRIGGTWDLFRYPGVRSDSDIFTLSFPWNPWRGKRTVAQGGEIREYLEQTASDFGIAEHITFNVDVAGADFDTSTDLWTVDALIDGEPTAIVTRFLYMCTGYYRYETGYRPEFPGEKDFQGTFVHPQFWPEDLDYAGKNVVVIGSGATAVTLIPSMAPQAGSVTMLQRSPSYMFPLPWEDGLTKLLQRVLPPQVSHNITRWRNAIATMLLFLFCRAFPKLSRRMLRRIAISLLPKGFDVDTHFKPRYEPWDQRLCIIPDGDFYRAIKNGTADVATDTIAQITATGIDLESGRHLEADIIVTATGLDLVTFGGAHLSIDGEPIEPGEKYAYRGYMLNDVPNLAWSVGYTNASWTLRVDLTAQAVAELLRYMRDHGFTRAVPSLRGATPKAHPLLELDSGYVKRAGGRLPKAGDRAPWQVRHNLILDAIDARKYDVEEEMTFA